MIGDRFVATRVRLFLLLATGALLGPRAWATVLPFPQSILHELLSESVPTAFPPMEVGPEDYALAWEGQAIDGVKVSLAERSLQWARVGEVLVLPRARLLVEARNIESGRLSYAGFTTPLSGKDRGNPGSASVLVALISGAQNLVDLHVLRGGKQIHGRILIRFKPRDRSAAPRVFRDPSCSRYGLKADWVSARGHDLASGDTDQWVYIGCRAIVAGGGESRTSNLEIYLFWDNAGQSIEIEGFPTPASAPSTWALKVNPDPGELGMRAGKNQLKLSYFLPERLHFAQLGMGLGPYSYSFDALGRTAYDTRPIVTFYGSFFFSESVRIVGFNATAIGKSGFSDFGIYLNSENFKIVDRRLSINLLLGGHAIAFQADGDTYFLLGAPQGVEMIYSDFLQKGANLSLGGFVYPNISGKAYNNVWIRWGSKVFAEINFILWEETVRERRVYSRSLGLSLGFPVAQFF